MAEKTTRMGLPPLGDLAAGYTGTDPAAVRKRIEAMEHLLEGLFTIPGINRKIGLDVLLDLIPVGGDTIGAVMGAIPWVGAVPDFFFRSNTRNLRMIKRHLDTHHPATAVIEQR